MPHFIGSSEEPWEKQVLYAFLCSIDYCETDLPDFEKVLQIHKEELRESQEDTGEEAWYEIFKGELENLLKEKKLSAIKEVLCKSENGTYVEDDKNIQYIERVYYEIYSDDPEFQGELVETSINKLLKIKF